jgi:hypothetical protein
MKFEPTYEQIGLAQDLYIAMAFRDLSKESFDKWESVILQEGTFRVHEKYIREPSLPKRVLPENGIIKNPRDICLMAGLDAYQTPGYEGSDAQLYHNILRSVAIEAGFIHGENALCRAENDVSEAERALIEGTQNIHHIKVENLTMLKHWKELIEILLNMFCQVVNNDSFSQKQAQYFTERHTGELGSNSQKNKG